MVSVISQALRVFCPNDLIVIDGDVQSEAQFLAQVKINNAPPTLPWDQVQAKVAELESLKPLRYLRDERDRKLQQSDCYAFPDFPHPSEDARQAWLDYRQALRDLPANSPDATIDPESGALIGVDWPDEPEH